MQISRHWRLNAQRYRLEGVVLEDGTLSLQQRYVPQTLADDTPELSSEPDQVENSFMTPILQKVAS